MLTSICAREFSEDGKPRPPIRFHAGLNTVQGTNRGKNSIGKSTVLYLVDWALGGSQFAETKTVRQPNAVGHHTVFFTYEFDGKVYYFGRSTETPDFVEEYTDNQHRQVMARHSKDQFTAWLKDKYGLGSREKSFRALLRPFTRIQESASAATRRPLATVPEEKPIKGIETLEDLFGLYKGLVDATKTLNAADADFKALNRAHNQKLLRAASIRTAKGAAEARAQLEQTDAEIRSLRNRTDNTLRVEDQERSSVAADLKAKLQEMRIIRGKLQAQASIAEQSLAGTPPIAQEDLDALAMYFPNVNMARLREVEGFHVQLTGALREEYRRQLDEFTRAIEQVEKHIGYVEDNIRALGKPVDIPDETWDEYGKLSTRRKALEIQLEIWDDKASLQKKRKELKDQLEGLRREAYREVRHAMNEELARLNDATTPDQQAPVLEFKDDGTNYAFGTPDDDGSGVADKDLSLFDLSVLKLTPLPVVIHDSVLFNNIEKDVVGRLLYLYLQTSKQVFISFDREQDYGGTPVEQIVNETSVITLGPDGKALYGWQWNKNTDEH